MVVGLVDLGSWGGGGKIWQTGGPSGGGGGGGCGGIGGLGAVAVAVVSTTAAVVSMAATEDQGQTLDGSLVGLGKDEGSS